MQRSTSPARLKFAASCAWLAFAMVASAAPAATFDLTAHQLDAQIFPHKLTG